MTDIQRPVVDPDLEALSKRYFQALASTPVLAPVSGGSIAESRRGRSRGLAAMGTVIALAGVLALSVYSLGHRVIPDPGGSHAATVAAVPTPCAPGSRPIVSSDLTGAPLANAIQQLDQWDSACEAAWWANLDLSTVDWATVSHRPGPVVDYAAPEFSTLKSAVAGADTVIVAHVKSISKSGQGQGVDFTLTIDQVLKGSPAPQLTLVDVGGLEPASGSLPTGLAIQDSPMWGFPLPGERVVVMGHAANTQIHAQGYTGLYFISSGGIVDTESGNPFRTTVARSTEASFVGEVKSVIAGG